MTRMGREFSLVLLGAGILTAGYFIAPTPEEELKKKAEEQDQRRVGGNGNTTYRSGGHFILFLHSPGYNRGGMTPPASPGVSRGGLGGIGRSAGAGGS
jgi:hypothetical protein